MSIGAEYHHETEQPEPPFLHIVPPPREEGAEVSRSLPTNTTEAAVALAGIIKNARVPLEKRDELRVKFRRESVSKILIDAGVITETDTQAEDFEENYRQAEDAANDLRGQHLMELADRYGEHPFTETIDELQKILRPTQYGDDVILMRRTGLILLEHAETE